MRRIALGFTCNNACIFCAQGELRSRPEDPSRGLVGARIDALVDAIEPGETVAFMGGEPTLEERLPAWIRAADARGAARILVQTNGRRLAYPAYAQALREASTRLVLDASLHGSTEPMHDYHTSAAGSFRQTILGLRNARAQRIEASITTVITRSNFRHLVEIVTLANALGARAVRFAPAEAYGSAARAADRVIPAWDLVKPHLVRAVAEATRLRLGVAVGDIASSPDIVNRFAGIGQVEHLEQADPARCSPSPSATPSAPSSPAEISAQGRRVSLAVLGRPAPAKQEVRAQVRKTGDELRAIFPALFDAPHVPQAPQAAGGTG
jgi:MoaA/NifB/PqqE/SkfB family radical SAM enzyme